MPKRAKSSHPNYDFFGVTTIGERGQAVIPSSAREKYRLKKGEKLLVFGLGSEMIALIKFDQVEELAASLETKLSMIRQALKSIN